MKKTFSTVEKDLSFFFFFFPFHGKKENEKKKKGVDLIKKKRSFLNWRAAKRKVNEIPSSSID